MNSERYPLDLFGLQESPFGAMVREKFPDFADDPLCSAKRRYSSYSSNIRPSCAVTLGPSFDVTVADGFEINYASIGETAPDGLPEGTIRNPPIAFDFSHQAHRSVQALMWIVYCGQPLA